MPGFGLVLGAGGGVGRAFHAGVLAALQDALGIDARDAQVIVGTSAGSLDGAFLRAGVAPRDLYARIAGGRVSATAGALYARLPEWVEPEQEGPAAGWRPASMRRFRTLASRPWTLAPRSMGTLVAAALPEGRRSTRLIEATVARLHPRGWPEAALWVPAVRLDDGTRVVFGRDATPPASVGHAVAASCAIPGYFAPVTVAGERFVDGGAHSPSNLDLVAGRRLDLVIVSSPMTAAPNTLRPSLDAAFRAGCRVLLRGEAARVRRRGTPVVMIEPTAEDVAVMGSVSDSMNPRHRARVARHVRDAFAVRLRGTLAAEFEAVRQA